jgi:3-oxoadipate enol-lactonase
MPTIEANGHTLYYELHGEGEPLVCVMGLSADTVTWTLQLPAFSARHRTLIFDNRDVGRSSLADGPYEIAHMARDTLALADALELDTFHVLGVSMGGAIAQEMALAAPGRVRTLTLAVTFPAGGAYAHKLSEVWPHGSTRSAARSTWTNSCFCATRRSSSRTRRRLPPCVG